MDLYERNRLREALAAWRQLLYQRFRLVGDDYLALLTRHAKVPG